MEEREKLELIKKLADKTRITEEEAREILERNSWDIIDSMLELERVGRIHDAGAKTGTGYSTENQNTQEFQQVTVTASRTSEESTGSKLKRILRKLFRKSLDNDFVISRKKKEIVHLPVLVMAIVLILWPWYTVFFLCVGLLTGFRYSFRGKDLGTDTVNQTMDKMAECAEDIKVKVRDFIDDEENTDSRRRR